jgi:hypothetical protein
MKAPVRRLTVSAPADQLDTLAAVLRDVQAAGRVAAVDLRAESRGELLLEVTI